MKSSVFKLIPAIALIFFLLTIINANPETNSQLMAERATAALAAAMKIDNPNPDEITNLLLQERFEEFEKLSITYQQQFLKDPLHEYPLYKLYTYLDGKNSLLLGKLNKWAKKKPSYISYGARGCYKVDRGG